jgi:hypothetical protein
MSMTRAMKLFMVGVLAIVAMGASVSTATASRGASVNASLATATGILTLTASGLTVTCTVRLGIQLSSSIAKSSGALIGSILLSPASTITNCNLGITGTVLNGITVTYSGFTGTLPNITSILGNTTNAAFLLQLPIFGSCLYRGGTIASTFNRSGGGLITTVGLNGSGLTSSGSCPGPATLRGTLTVDSPQPTVTLI